MECPKCHKVISDDSKVCTYCHKVLALVCPNCKTLGQSAVCENCGYIILEKCSKCGKLIPTTMEKCKCGFSVSTSVAYNECESDEFASVTVKFDALKSISRQLGSKELLKKFKIRLKNLLIAQLKNIDGKIITYGDTYVINFNKELSFQTSAHKAVRFGLKIINAFTDLNKKVLDEINTSLKLRVTVHKKNAENLLSEESLENNIKLLSMAKQEKKYLKDMQLIVDQFIQDVVNKEYKTDSLYTLELFGKTIMFYSVILDNYVIPPEDNSERKDITAVNTAVIKDKKILQRETPETFKVFNINAKCKFERVTINEINDYLATNKIISIRSDSDLEMITNDIVKVYENKGLRVIRAVCNEDNNYAPWNVFLQLYRDYNKLSVNKNLLPEQFDTKKFESIKNLACDIPLKASSSEDARFAYMEEFGRFLTSLKDCAILIEGCENLDDTTKQTLELYFDKYKKINSYFIFVTDSDNPLHHKIKSLLQTKLYTEISLLSTNINSLISNMTCDVSDFIQSFYYEKICDNYDGSYLYFKHAIEHLKEKNALVFMDDKLIVKSNSSVVLPTDLKSLLRARLKYLSKNVDASMILAYFALIGHCLDFESLSILGIKNFEQNVEILEKSGFVYKKDNYIYVNNYNYIKPIIINSLKKEALNFLCKNILANIGSGLNIHALIRLFDKIDNNEQESKLILKNSEISITTGDYDAYLKNSLEFISVIERIENNIPENELANIKNEIYQNIFTSLYHYSPEKIYSISNALLMDAIKHDDEDKIKRLSNLMLQGALISSNYTDAGKLLHNILVRMTEPVLIVNGAVNTKFLLLSLVNIEILFNTGFYDECIDIAENLLNVIVPDIIEKIKPPGFSLNLFVEHLLDTFRLVSFAKLFRFDNDLEDFFDKIKNSLGDDLPEKDCILAIKAHFAGIKYVPSITENSSAFSKVVYLILKEFANPDNNQKEFAQNIYQAKLLASDLNQVQLELFCDLMIAFAYANIGRIQKAESIYKDVLEKTEYSSEFNILCIVKYLIARLNVSENKIDDALFIINMALDDIQRRNVSAKVFYALYNGLLINIANSGDKTDIDIDNITHKLEVMFPNNEAKKLLE